MLQISDFSELRRVIQLWKANGEQVAFVPTMGNLHAGHLSLIDIAKSHAQRVVCSIFVNPLQFAVDEDLDAYPRTLEQDAAALQQQQCDLLFLPSDQTLYPQGFKQITTVSVPEITTDKEGAFRPDHFRGVSTVVLKLFNLVQPDYAVFGKKDYQQWRTVEKMVADLNLALTIIPGETIREPSGLAMSSRNLYLSDEEHQRAAMLQQSLRVIGQAINDNPQVSFSDCCQQQKLKLEQTGFEVDYLEVCDRHSLQPTQNSDHDLVVLVAARIGKTRLIDNLEIQA